MLRDICHLKPSVPLLNDDTHIWQRETNHLCEQARSMFVVSRCLFFFTVVYSRYLSRFFLLLMLSSFFFLLILTYNIILCNFWEIIIIVIMIEKDSCILFPLLFFQSLLLLHVHLKWEKILQIILVLSHAFLYRTCLMMNMR